MLKRVFKRPDSRNYRLRYRLNDGRLLEASLHTPIKEIAEAQADKLIREEEDAILGRGPAKSVREATLRPLKEHLAYFVESLTARRCGKSPIVHTPCRRVR